MATLQSIKARGDHNDNQRVVCCRCGQLTNVLQVKADPTGPAFKAYYCDRGCSEWREQEAAKGLPDPAFQKPEGVNTAALVNGGLQAKQN